MTSISRVRLLAGVLALAGFGLLARLDAQEPAQNADVLPQLLVEVHGLRVAMEQAATTGPRVQLLTGRLQIEEARISDMVRRLDVIHAAETTAAREADELRAQSDRLETDPAGNLTQEDRDQLEKMKPDIKRRLARAQATLEGEKLEEAQLQTDIATEQARWTAFSDQLDALDRELSKR